MKFPVIFARSVRCPGLKEIQPRAAHTVVKVRGGESAILALGWISHYFPVFLFFYFHFFSQYRVDPFKSKVGYGSLFGASLTNAGQVVIRLKGRIHANLAISTLDDQRR